jgi:hypothetical protein
MRNALSAQQRDFNCQFAHPGSWWFRCYLQPEHAHRLQLRRGRVSVLVGGAGKQRMAGQANAKTTGLYDRRNDDISVGEVERIGI